jgi:L-ascorbate metabolism protein UlaG (beta-lactamase superfamily)
MELQFFGANCLKVSSKKATVVVDDNLEALGKSSVTKAGDVRVFTGSAPEDQLEGSFVVAQPGEYEIADVSITGVAAQAHIDEPGSKNATMYRIVIDDVRLAVVGHIDPKLTESQLEALGTIDVLAVPVGGNGFTLDAVGAQQIIKAIEPKLVIPTYYADSKLKFEVPAASLDEALKGLGMEPKERVAKLKVKTSDLLSDQTQLVVLEA